MRRYVFVGLIAAATLGAACAVSFANEPVTYENGPLAPVDAQMGRTLAELNRRLVDSDAREQLKQSQTAWIAYRDAECGWETFGSRGGTIRASLQADCMARLTTLRIKDLQDQLNCPADTVGCNALNP